MYLAILKKENKQIIFSTFTQNPFDEIIQKYIDEMISSNEDYKKLDDFHFSIQFGNDLIYLAIEPYDGFRLKYDNIRNYSVNKKKLIKMVKNFSKILTKDDINLLKTGDPLNLLLTKPSTEELILNHLKNNIIFNRIISTLFPFDTEIRFIGESNSGLSSIFYLLIGLNISSEYQDNLVPLKKMKKDKSILIKKFNIPRGYSGFYDKILPKENKIFYIIDSTNKYHLKMNPSIRNALNRNDLDQKILIIANKQDLSGAFLPKEIEKKLGFPTVGFSTVQPDAPKHLKQILSDF